MVIGFSAVLLLVDILFWRVGLELPVRTGLWAAALFGLYAGQVARVELGHPVWAQVMGVCSTLLAFLLFYFLERRLGQPSASPARG